LVIGVDFLNKSYEEILDCISRDDICNVERIESEDYVYSLELYNKLIWYTCYLNSFNMTCIKQLCLKSYEDDVKNNRPNIIEELARVSGYNIDDAKEHETGLDVLKKYQRSTGYINSATRLY